MELSESGVRRVEKPAQVRKPYFRSRRFERHYPYIGGTVAALAWFLLGAPAPQPATYGMALIATFTVAAIVSGFLGSATSILTGLDSRVMRRIRESNAIYSLSAYLLEGMVAGVVVMVVAMSGFFLPYPFGPVYLSIWIGSLVFLALVFLRVARIMSVLLVEKPKVIED